MGCRNPVGRDRREAPSFTPRVSALTMTFTKERSVADTTGMVYLLPKPKLIYDIQNPLFLVNVLVFPQTFMVLCFVLFSMERASHYFS